MSSSTNQLPPLPPPPQPFIPSSSPAQIIIPGLDVTAPLNDQIEQMDQLITIKLQNIDINFSKIQELMASKVLPAFRRYAVATEPVRDAANFWVSFYEAAAKVHMPVPGSYGEPSGDTSTSISQSYDPTPSQETETETETDTTIDADATSATDRTYIQPQSKDRGHYDCAETPARPRSHSRTHSHSRERSRQRHEREREREREEGDESSRLEFDPDTTPSETSFNPSHDLISSTPLPLHHRHFNPHHPHHHDHHQNRSYDDTPERTSSHPSIKEREGGRERGREGGRGREEWKSTLETPMQRIGRELKNLELSEPGRRALGVHHSHTSGDGSMTGTTESSLFEPSLEFSGLRTGSSTKKGSARKEKKRGDMRSGILKHNHHTTHHAQAQHANKTGTPNRPKTKNPFVSRLDLSDDGIYDLARSPSLVGSPSPAKRRDRRGGGFTGGGASGRGVGGYGSGTPSHLQSQDNSETPSLPHAPSLRPSHTSHPSHSGSGSSKRDEWEEEDSDEGNSSDSDSIFPPGMSPLQTITLDIPGLGIRGRNLAGRYSTLPALHGLNTGTGAGTGATGTGVRSGIGGGGGGIFGVGGLRQTPVKEAGARVERDLIAGVLAGRQSSSSSSAQSFSNASAQSSAQANTRAHGQSGSGTGTGLFKTMRSNLAPVGSVGSVQRSGRSDADAGAGKGTDALLDAGVDVNQPSFSHPSNQLPFDRSEFDRPPFSLPSVDRPPFDLPSVGRSGFTGNQSGLDSVMETPSLSMSGLDEELTRRVGLGIQGKGKGKNKMVDDEDGDNLFDERFDNLHDTDNFDNDNLYSRNENMDGEGSGSSDDGTFPGLGIPEDTYGADPGLGLGRNDHGHGPVVGRLIDDGLSDSSDEDGEDPSGAGFGLGFGLGLGSKEVGEDSFDDENSHDGTHTGTNTDNFLNPRTARGGRGGEFAIKGAFLEDTLGIGGIVGEKASPTPGGRVL
ncbi:hypothetical protein SISSUDRAFT_1130406 [Sistotremastrum suecicum HHB10207 ss-3]|uniref:DASH complex subunit ASK1 n=1 Tax=Sistotremastrum suecicum HHB10207 ss-3 TaxID=1314776 RepID=A0A166BH28_9AGAM|nr:hypothetical protein SISSUDRAFT_1130406 [Sistotremastrum suecicum HHB10207 ss-3]